MSGQEIPLDRTQLRNASRNEVSRSGICLGLIVLACSLVLPSLASAEYRAYRNSNNTEDYGREGFYVGGGLVGGFTTRLQDELSDEPGVDDVEVDPSVGLAGRVGMRVTPHFAVEAHYEWMNDFETSIAGVEVAETRTSVLTGDLKGYLTTGRVQPFLSAGLGFMSAKSDDPSTSFQRTDTDFAARFGGGVDFYVNRHIGFTLDTSYVVPAGDVEDLDYVSVGAGVFFRF